ncbi:MAG: hypothetical protein H7144_00290, partial [Burkholderiales bacterium]|nr:hypothetical protein [Phycisphaerae bacterium]
MNRHLYLSATCAMVIASAVACSSDPEPMPLGADQFYRPTDRDGALPPAPAQRLALQQRQQTSAAPDPVPSAEGMTFVAEQVKSATPEGAAPPTPATVPASVNEPRFAPGQYLSVGGVVAEVNGNPIYADAVLRAIAPALAGRAKDLDVPKFRSVAASETNRQVDDMIRAEVEYAAAVRNT